MPIIDHRRFPLDRLVPCQILGSHNSSPLLHGRNDVRRNRRVGVEKVGTLVCESFEGVGKLLPVASVSQAEDCAIWCVNLGEKGVLGDEWSVL